MVKKNTMLNKGMPSMKKITLFSTLLVLSLCLRGQAETVPSVPHIVDPYIADKDHDDRDYHHDDDRRNYDDDDNDNGFLWWGGNGDDDGRDHDHDDHRDHDDDHRGDHDNGKRGDSGKHH